jgi:hypothetical protein
LVHEEPLVFFIAWWIRLGNVTSPKKAKEGSLSQSYEQLEGMSSASLNLLLDVK